MTSTEAEFMRLMRKQWAYGSFRIRGLGTYIDISLRVWRVGFRINRDHRSRKIFLRAA